MRRDAYNVRESLRKEAGNGQQHKHNRRGAGGLYGRLRVDQLGKTQPDTRNPVLVTAMEVLGETENRYSGIPRIQHAMEEMGLPAPVFADSRGTFTVTLFNGDNTVKQLKEISSVEDEKGLIAFCRTPRSRKEILDYLAIPSRQYAQKRYLEPLIRAGLIAMSEPDHPKSPRQRFYTVE